jgi:hypothetical protein
MKILLVSMASLHFFRWTEQLKDSGHEVYWFDVLDIGKPSERIPWVHQITDWKRRWNFLGRYLIKNKFPITYKYIQKVNERNTTYEFEKIVLKIQPDVIHSFAINIAGIPIIDVMLKHEKVKWILSTWGSDLFFLIKDPLYLKDVKAVLPRVNYLFTDCNRDYTIAKELGFNGSYLGVYPGGGGFDFVQYNHYITPPKERNVILIKGFQGEIGRCIQVIKAFEMMSIELSNYKLVIFGACPDVVLYVNRQNLSKSHNLIVYEKITHEQVLKLMGKALIYIGNSLSDGLPNTLLEAIVMGAFPIQSNPGGATRELIKTKFNGMLIENPNDYNEIKNILLEVLHNPSIIYEGIEYNCTNLKPRFEYDFIKNEVLKKYEVVKSN